MKVHSPNNLESENIMEIALPPLHLCSMGILGQIPIPA